jgi:hypothetical protein
MSFRAWSVALLFVTRVALAQTPLPELRTEPTGGGSIFDVRNISSQPLTAFLIELVDYPGSSYAFFEDDLTSEVIAPGVEKRIAVANMTVGAVPDYVKIVAALYADGSSSGTTEKVAQLVERRRFLLQTTRDLIGRLQKAQAAGTQPASAIAELKQWADSMQPAAKGNRNSQRAINEAAAKSLIAETTARLETHSLNDALTWLHGCERTLTASRPAL